MVMYDNHLERRRIQKILYGQKESFACGTNAGNPEWARWARLARSGSQSECGIRFTLPAREFSLVIKAFLD